jgi:hypothetical protein
METYSMFDTCDPNDPKDAAKLAQFKRMAVPMLDHQIRNTLNMIWMALPPERQNAVAAFGLPPPSE